VVKDEKNDKARRASGRDALRNAFSDLALLLIDQGITAAEMHSVLAEAFIRSAVQRSKMKNGRVNQSRVAIMTGLTRTEVRRQLDLTAKIPSMTELHGARRLLNGWSRDPEFCTSEGKPRELRLSGGYGSFQSLARRYSGDIPAKATLDELQRLDAAVVARGIIQMKPESDAQSRRRAKVLTQVAAQFSDVLQGLGYPIALSPTIVLSDSVSVDVADSAALQIVRQRAEQSAKALLGGMEASTRNIVRTQRGAARRTRRRVRISVTISQFTPPK
jgi:hypothetical protein